MEYKFICYNNPEHLFEEPTSDYWCDKCPFELRSMLVTYAEEPENQQHLKDANSSEYSKSNDLVEAVDSINNKANTDNENSKIATDISKKIPVVSIGNQSWMAVNLQTDVFLNGDKIFHANTEKAWNMAGAQKIPAWCYPENNELLGNKYGKLYNWYAVSDPRGICSDEFKIPGMEDIKKLLTFLKNNNQNADHLKAKNQWKLEGSGLDFYNMNILPYPKRFAMGTFALDGFTSAFWTINQFVHYTAYYWELRADKNEIILSNADKNAGFLIRCIRK